MMWLGNADELITPFLQHPDFEEFEKRTPRLQELTEQIRTFHQKTKPHHFGMKYTEVDEETEAAFLEFAEICKNGLRPLT